MKLIDAYTHIEAPEILYELLKQREPWQSISHREMPTWEEHCAFVESRPYQAWYLVFLDGVLAPVGAVYLSKRDEIGVQIFRQFQGRGLGPGAVCKLMEMHPRLYFLANVAPGNETSRAMFRAMGFGLIQETYRLDG